MALHAFWVHGTITEVENPELLAPVAPDAVQAAFTRRGGAPSSSGRRTPATGSTSPSPPRS